MKYTGVGISPRGLMFLCFFLGFVFFPLWIIAAILFIKELLNWVDSQKEGEK